MAANVAKIEPISADNQWGAAAITAANTAKDGTGTVTTVFTAPTDGGFVQKLVFQSYGTNVATVARVFLNNGGSNATAANNSFFKDVALPATTLNEAGEMGNVELTLNLGIEAAHKLNVVLGTAVAAGWAVTAVAARYS